VADSQAVAAALSASGAVTEARHVVGAPATLVTAVTSMPVERANRGFREHRGLHHSFVQAATKRFAGTRREAAISDRWFAPR